MSYAETLRELRQFMSYVKMKLTVIETKLDNMQKIEQGNFYNPTINKLEKIK